MSDVAMGIPREGLDPPVGAAQFGTDWSVIYPTRLTSD